MREKSDVGFGVFIGTLMTIGIIMLGMGCYGLGVIHGVNGGHCALKPEDCLPRPATPH